MTQAEQAKAKRDARRYIKWNGDFEASRAAADAGNFDKELAKAVGQEMLTDYNKQEGKQFFLGWSMCSSSYFERLWTLDDRVKPLLEADAKVLFLASSDVLRDLLFPNAQKSVEDLRNRMSRLCEMSVEMSELTDEWRECIEWEVVEAKEEVYQTLFQETTRIYAA